MIGRITGVVVERTPPFLVIDTGAVAYELQAPMTTFDKLPPEGQTLTLVTHHLVRNDHQALYGFADTRERDLFRTLIRVSGIGPKLALIILSGMSMERFTHCVHQGDSGSLTGLPGVGPKTAERLLFELRDKLPYHRDIGTEPEEAVRPEQDDAVSVLIALGYSAREARQAVSRVADTGLGTEQLVKAALTAILS